MNVGSAGREEPHHRFGDFLGFAGATQGSRCADRASRGIAAVDFVNVRENRAGAYAVHSNAFAADLARQAFGEAVHRALARRVVRFLREATKSGATRGNIDDRAAFSPVL